jgi:hypothetical protein
MTALLMAKVSQREEFEDPNETVLLKTVMLLGSL